ncbi:MAG: hypothetical protein U5L95_00025 [Candidatus Saccharibacteria bacterium]|nr:hypothetical protein [Candidatus Saccharibacteria bacterium]
MEFDPDLRMLLFSQGEQNRFGFDAMHQAEEAPELTASVANVLSMAVTGMQQAITAGDESSHTKLEEIKTIEKTYKQLLPFGEAILGSEIDKMLDDLGNDNDS